MAKKTKTTKAVYLIGPTTLLIEGEEKVVRHKNFIVSDCKVIVTFDDASVITLDYEEVVTYVYEDRGIDYWVDDGCDGGYDIRDSDLWGHSGNRYGG